MDQDGDEQVWRPKLDEFENLQLSFDLFFDDLKDGYKDHQGQKRTEPEWVSLALASISEYVWARENYMRLRGTETTEFKDSERRKFVDHMSRCIQELSVAAFGLYYDAE